MISAQPVVSACAAVERGAVSFSDKAAIAGRVLRLVDVADLSRLPSPLRERAGRLTLPWRLGRVGRIDTSTLASVVRARMPLLSCWLPRKTKGVITIGPLPSADTAHSVVAANVSDSAVQPGDTVALAVGIGAVKIERQVEVMQKAVSGQRLFVRDSDGKLISVRYTEAR